MLYRVFEALDIFAGECQIIDIEAFLPQVFEKDTVEFGIV